MSDAARAPAADTPRPLALEVAPPGPPRTPTDLAAVAFLLVSQVALGLASGSRLLVGPLVVATLLAPVLGGRLVVDLAAIGHLFLFVPFGLGLRFWQIEGSGGLGLNEPFWVSLYLQTVALLRLWGPPSPLRFPLVLFAGGASISACGADVRHLPYALLVVAATFPLLVLARAHLPPAPVGAPRARRGLIFGLFGLVLALTAGSSVVYFKHYDAFRREVRRRARSSPPPSSGGFSGNARLGDIVSGQDGDAGEEVSLRVFAKRLPGYLRGRVFMTYAKGEWAPAPVQSEKDARRIGGEVAPYVYLLPERRPPASTEPEIEVRPVEALGRFFFMPLRASALESLCTRVSVLGGGSLATRSASTAAGYRVFLDSTPVVGESPEDLALPDDPALVAALDRTIARLERKGVGPVESYRAVLRHFARNYDYKFGIRFEPGSDPLVQFLDSKKEGHCELFASAGTLLLRRLGVRARYVSGFTVVERSPLVEDLWLARHRHAHAWVEWLDPATGWTEGELTPATGLPSSKPKDGVPSWLDAVRGEWERLAALFAREGVLVVLGKLLAGLGGWLFGEPWRVAVLALGGGYVAWRRLRPRFRAASPSAALRPLSRSLAEERERFRALERTLARRGLGKHGSETLEEYARRLDGETFPDREGAVGLIRGFAVRRYAPDEGGA